jgi:hypothetical protein
MSGLTDRALGVEDPTQPSGFRDQSIAFHVRMLDHNAAGVESAIDRINAG